MALEDHPGYLGFTSQGVIAIHANWPAYPLEHGWQSLLMSLGSFPPDTDFHRIDDIDQCALFVAPRYGEYADPYDERSFHVALWHEDLLEANELGLVTGVEDLTQREFDRRRLNEFRRDVRASLTKDGREAPPGDILDYIGTEVDGKFIPLDWRTLFNYCEDEDLDEDGEEDDWEENIYSGGRLGLEADNKLRLTQQGWQRLEELWVEALDFPDRIQLRMNALVEAQLYDAALRDISVIIESTMREVCASKDFGAKLVDRFIDHAGKTGRFRSSGLKMVRGETRTAFKFVRNEFAHNLVDLPRPRAFALLSRMSHVLLEVDDIVAALQDD
jgi:hypothetical protein